jgi:hypothetical protein
VKRGPLWSDAADLMAWLHQLREVSRDLGEAALDLGRPEADRVLGPTLARETLAESRTQLYEMLDLAMASLAEGGSRSRSRTDGSIERWTRAPLSRTGRAPRRPPHPGGERHLG